jgi:hypothetical protein
MGVRGAHPRHTKGFTMPLSEEEQRILQQIEQQFYESDPAFAQTVRSSTLYRHGVRKAIGGGVLLVAGLAFLLFALQINYVLALVGFLVMLAGAFVIEKNLRAVGRAGVQDLMHNTRTTKLRESLGAERLKRRRRTDGDQG